MTFEDAYAAATPLLKADGALIAAISAAVDATQAGRLGELGEQLRSAVVALAPRYGINGR